MDYNDQRIKLVDQEKAAALNSSNATYNQLLTDNANLTQQNNAWMDEWKKTQDGVINKQVDFNQGLLNQKKDEADKDYQKEAVASNVDYNKMVNPYGVQAENQAQNGLNGTGFSESSKVNAWNTMQNRTALARATTQKIKADFDNQIAQARLNGDAQMAENALKVMEQRMANAQREFEFKSETKQNQLNYNSQLDNTYYGRKQDVFNQQNYEQEQATAQKRWQDEMAYKKQQDEIAQRQYQEQMAYKQQQDAIAQANWQREFSAAQSASSQKAATQEKQSNMINSAGGLLAYKGGGWDANGVQVIRNGNKTTYLDTVTGKKTTINSNVNPFTGTVNKDTERGTFSNGYQPSYIGDKKLSNTGKKTSYNGQNQNIYKSAANTYWVWDGKQNKYVRI